MKKLEPRIDQTTGFVEGTVNLVVSENVILLSNLQKEYEKTSDGQTHMVFEPRVYRFHELPQLVFGIGTFIHFAQTHTSPIHYLNDQDGSIAAPAVFRPYHGVKIPYLKNARLETIDVKVQGRLAEFATSTSPDVLSLLPSYRSQQ